MKMNYIHRMIVEKNELESKLGKLSNLLENYENNPPARVFKLSETQLNLMNRQREAMTEYLSILNTRIEYETER